MIILTSSFHYISIYPLIQYCNINNIHIFHYINIILISSSFSILYHTFNESNHVITFIDYFLAVIWGLYDILLSLSDDFRIIKIFVMNFIIFITNKCISYDDDYEYYHSIWHIISAIKCFYVSLLISRKQ